MTTTTINPSLPADVSASKVPERKPIELQALPEVTDIKPVETAEPVDAENLREAVAKIGDFIQIVRRNLLFDISEETGRTIITVVDTDTQEIVRQIPPEEVLSVARTLDGLRGLLLKTKA